VIIFSLASRKKKIQETPMATLRVDVINKILCERIEQYNRKVGIENIGRVVQVRDGIACIIGLDDEIILGELVEFALGQRDEPHCSEFGIKNVGIVLKGDGLMIQEESFVKAKNCSDTRERGFTWAVL